MKSKVVSVIFVMFTVFMVFSTSVYADLENNSELLKWKGLNPFHQPAQTTYYYGSGDSNLDGVFNNNDASYVAEILNGTKKENIMSDVNGDGKITFDDLRVMVSALNNNGVLPGWWNKLTSKEQRIDWVKKMMEIDKNDKLPYNLNYACTSFASHIYIKSSYYRWDLESHGFSGNQTVFNLPMYINDLYCKDANFYHTINCILVGDDPLKFDDWLFIEPQEDSIVKPGDWSIPSGSEISIKYNQGFNTTNLGSNRLIDFKNSSSGNAVIYSDANLIKSRPQVQASPMLNVEDRWNPKVLTVGSGYLFFGQMRKDMSRVTDIHINSLQNPNLDTAVPLKNDDIYSKIVDVCAGTAGTAHLIWQGQYIEPISNNNLYEHRYKGLYYGKLNLATGVISEKVWLGDVNNGILKGRILCAPDGKINVFLHDRTNNKINWYYKADNTWSPAITVAENVSNIESYGIDTRYSAKYSFEAVINDSGEMQLAWLNIDTTNKTNKIMHRTYSPVSQNWGDIKQVVSKTGNVNISGLSMSWDGKSTHLAYWDGELIYTVLKANSYRGNIYLMSNTESVWSKPICMDNSQQSNSVKLVSSKDGKTCMIWDRRIDTLSKPVYTLKNEDGSWQVPTVLGVRNGAEALYPDAAFTEDNNIWFWWSSRDSKTIEIETKKIPLSILNLENPKSPALYYSFDNDKNDGKTLDMSGNGNNGKFMWATFPSYVTGAKSKGISFNGTNYIIASENPSLENIGAKDISISCWVKTSATGGCILDKRDANGIGFTLQLYSGVPLLQVVDSEKGYFNYYTTSMTKINDNKWHLITVTMDRDSSTGVKIYTDGVLRTSKNALYRTGNLSNKAFIHVGMKKEEKEYLVGSIDELRLYERVLLNEEIENLYKDIFKTAAFSFDNGLKDVSGSGNTATLAGYGYYVAGRKNTGIDFKNSHAVTIKDNPSLNFGTGDFSVSFWMKRDTGIEAQVIEKIDSVNKTGYGIRLYSTGLGYQFGNSNNIWSTAMNINGVDLNDNNWHNIVLTIQKSDVTYINIYVDGVKKSTSNALYPIIASSNSPLIIGDGTLLGNKYNGSLDELNFYQKALTPEEVLNIYN